MVVGSAPQQLAPLYVAIIVGGGWARAECRNWQGEFRATTSRCRWVWAVASYLLDAGHGEGGLRKEKAMRKPVCWFLTTSVLMCWSPAVLGQDLFERALQTMTNQMIQDAGFDRSGVLLRGGLQVGYPAIGASPVPFPTLDIGTHVGSLAIGEGLIRDLSKLLDPNALAGSLVSGLQAAVNDLLNAAISSLPMVTSCYAGPTLCDITKHQQGLAMLSQQGSVALQEMGSNLLGGLTSKLRATRVQRCIDDMRRPGAGGAVTVTLAEAQSACAGAAAGGIVDPLDGSRKSSVELITRSLERANASPAIKDFAADVIGDIRVEQGSSNEEPLKTTVVRPQKRLHDVFEADKADLDARLSAVVTVIEGGGTPTATQMRELSLPGAPMPGGVLFSLAGLRITDELAYDAYRSKLAGNLALVKLNWKVHELQDHLDEGMLTNTELGEAERDIIVQRQERLRREMRRVVQEKELAEAHVLPVMESVLRDHESEQRRAARRGMGAPADRRMSGNRWGTQNSLGYSY